jgi:hypothetical protein
MFYKRVCILSTSTLLEFKASKQDHSFINKESNSIFAFVLSTLMEYKTKPLEFYF